MTVGWVTRPSVMDEARQYIPLALRTLVATET